MPSALNPRRDSFERIERKFIFTKDDLAPLQALLEKQTRPSYPDPATSFNDIESIYFDSPELEIFRAHYTTLTGRFKLRTRTYGPNGHWHPDCVYLEMKMKNFEITEKFRIQLSENLAHDVLTQDYSSALPLEFRLTRDLRFLNSGVELRELTRRLQTLEQTFRDLKLRPMARVTYRRKAFEGEGIRITLDEDIRSDLLNDISESARLQTLGAPFWTDADRMAAQYHRLDTVILEVKSKSAIPDWLSDFLKEHRIAETRFSKYCYAIAKSLRETQAFVFNPEPVRDTARRGWA